MQKITLMHHRVCAASSGVDATLQRDSMSSRKLPPFSEWTRGFCGRTDADRGGHCTPNDFKGSWALGLSPEQCVARCIGCPRCGYVSYSPADLDCSWFALSTNLTMKKKLRIDCEKLRTGFSWVRGSTGHRTLRVRGDDGLPLYGKREAPSEPHRTLVLLLGGLRGGEAAWSSLYRNLVEPNRPHIDVALVLGIKASRLAWARKTSLVQRATYAWLMREVPEWGSQLDELANSTSWRNTLAAQHASGELGVHGHAAFGGVMLSRCRACQSSCTSRHEPWLGGGHVPICKHCRRQCIGGTGVINYVMRWRACASKLERNEPNVPLTAGWPLNHLSSFWPTDGSRSWNSAWRTVMHVSSSHAPTCFMPVVSTSCRAAALPLTKTTSAVGCVSTFRKVKTGTASTIGSPSARGMPSASLLRQLAMLINTHPS